MTIKRKRQAGIHIQDVQKSIVFGEIKQHMLNLYMKISFSANDSPVSWLYVCV